jgi:hypothetical protein
MLGSAEALAKALYKRRYADGYPRDLVRVHHEGDVVFVYGLLDYKSQPENPSRTFNANQTRKPRLSGREQTGFLDQKI